MTSSTSSLNSPAALTIPWKEREFVEKFKQRTLILETHTLLAKKESSQKIGNQPTNGPTRPDKHIPSVNAFTPRIIATVGSSTDLTTAQMFIQGNRLPRTPPRDSSPRLPDSSLTTGITGGGLREKSHPGHLLGMLQDWPFEEELQDVASNCSIQHYRIPLWTI